MGQQIASGYDDKVTAVENITGTDAEFANRIVETLILTKSANNSLGTASLANTGSTAGNVPVLGNTGLLATSLINATATGGAATDAGKVALLNSAGQIASTMIGSSGGGGSGLKHLSFYNGRSGPGNSNLGVESGRQWVWTGANKWVKPSNVTSLLIVASGGGGSGAYGPDSTGPNPDGTGGTVHGRNTRKGGGGAAGSTSIVYIPSPLADYDVRIGRGGASRPFGQDSATTYGGGTTQFGSSISAQGGNPGNKNGNGGTPRTATPGNSTHGEGFLGGQGHDGTEAIWGAGSGGSSLWGGGYSGGGGVGVPVAGVVSASPSAGGGAANGTDAQGFRAQRPGHAGNDGCLLILGF